MRNTIKYISRAGRKDDIIQDLEKAEFYWELAAKAGNKTAINNLIKFYKNRNNTEKVDVWTSKLK